MLLSKVAGVVPLLPTGGTAVIDVTDNDNDNTEKKRHGHKAHDNQR